MIKTIKGKECGIYQRNGHRIWVSRDAEYAAICSSDFKPGKRLDILHDFNESFVLMKDGTMLNILNAVLLNFGPDSPDDGQSYEINHIDGDWTNCSRDNLEWAPYHYRHSQKDKEILYSHGRFIEVHSDGTIWHDGNHFPIWDHWVDHDMDLEFPSFNTYIWIQLDEREDVDDLMKECGYVQGDDAGLKNPVILHRDLDYHNCASENLEWVEASDPRFKAFCEKRDEERRALNLELNKGHHIPDYWVR